MRTKKARPTLSIDFKKRLYKKRLVKFLRPYLVTLTLRRHRYISDANLRTLQSRIQDPPGISDPTTKYRGCRYFIKMQKIGHFFIKQEKNDVF